MIIYIYLSTDKSTEGKGGIIASVQAIGVQMTNIDLDRAMVLGSNKPIGRRTTRTTKHESSTSKTQKCKQTKKKSEATDKLPLARDVEIHHLTLFVLHLARIDGMGFAQRRRTPEDLQNEKRISIGVKQNGDQNQERETTNSREALSTTSKDWEGEEIGKRRVAAIPCREVGGGCRRRAEAMRVLLYRNPSGWSDGVEKTKLAPLCGSVFWAGELAPWLGFVLEAGPTRSKWDPRFPFCFFNNRMKITTASSIFRAMLNPLGLLNCRKHYP